MKRGLTLLFCGLITAVMVMAQDRHELPRTPMVSYQSAAEARAQNSAPSRYLQPLDTWKRQDGTWSTTFKVPFDWADRRVFLHVSSAGSDYKITVNGKAEYTGRGATATEFDLTGTAQEGMNTLTISVTGEDLLSAAADKGLGKVYIVSQPRVRIRDYVISPLSGAVELGVIVKSHLLNPKTVRVYYSLANPDGSAGPYGHRDANFEMKLEDTVRFYIPLPEPRLWSHETPYLYTLDLKLQHEGRYTEYISYKVGLRTMEHRDGRLIVNGRPVTLSAANTLHLHRPAPDSVYAAADKRGVYVIGTADINTSRFGSSRTRGGNPSNDPQWEKEYVNRATAMYYTSQTHPSAAVFALAEASANGYNLYESYLAMKCAEPSRPIIYPDGGEWNSDTLLLGEVVRQPFVEVTHMRDTTWMDGKRERRGGIFQLTNRFETATLYNLIVDWRSGRMRGSTTLKGVLPASQAREFIVDYGKTATAGNFSFKIFRPAEHFDQPGSTDKRGLISVPLK